MPSEFVHILHGEKDVCPDLDDVMREFGTIEATLDTAPLEFFRWTVREFVADPNLVRSIFLAADNASAFFACFARWCAANGIPATVPPPRFREALARTVLRSFFPRWQDIAHLAKGGMSENTVRELLRRVPRGGW